MSLDWLYDSHGTEGNSQEFFKLAQELEAKEELRAAATAYDRAYNLAPDDAVIASARQKILDQLAIVELGITFRYIPAGSFLMGSKDGEPDEQPVHAVKLNGFWLSETPLSWAKYYQLMDYQAPPNGRADEGWESRQSKEWIEQVREMTPKSDRWGVLDWKYYLNAYDRICFQYCENETLQARDWHAHIPDMEWKRSDGTTQTSAELFGGVPRENNERPIAYDEKPLVSIPYIATQALGLRISTDTIQYRLPTEAEWEKAARGGLINAKYPWGNEPPTHDICDFGRFRDFSIRKMKAFAPNGYGLYAMCGGVWEWVQDRYDAQYYSESPKENPIGSQEGEEYVLRGGSWADDAEVLSVSFRMSSRDITTPNIGIRLCRVER